MSNSIVNGVPVSAVEGLVSSVRSDPAKGQTKWNAVTRWKGGFECESTIRSHRVYMNEPRALGGTDTAPNMVESVLAAYGSCLTVGYALNAALRGITIKDLKIEVEGDLDLAGFFGLSEGVPAGFSGVRARVHLVSDASPAEIQSLHAHVMKTSPVGSILERPLKVSTELV